MNRTNTIIAALLVALGAAFGYGWFATTSATAPAGLSSADVRAIVETALDERGAPDVQSGNVDPGAIQPIIENYLLANPRILEQMSIALDAELRIEQREQSRVALASVDDGLYSDPDHVVVGNPDGDVTLVEFFDYNCAYCRQSVPDVMQLLAEDPGLRVILKEFPILSEGSVDAARIGVLVARNEVDYLDFHTALFAARGTVDRQAALDAARELGLNPIDLELQMNDATVVDVVQRSYTLAQTLGITGTPAFILGDEVVRGAVGIDVLRTKIANLRQCGSTVCDG